MNTLTELLGYLFCEFSFRWFDRFQGTPFVGDMDDHTEADVKWHHHLITGVGARSYSLGCRFYNLTHH